MLPKIVDHPLLKTASAATLRMIANALRSGQIASPVSSFAVAAVAPIDIALAAELQRLSAEGMSTAHLALVVELAAAAADAKVTADSVAELVWTGPEIRGSCSRDTSVVLDELFGQATRSILISTFVIQQAERVFSSVMRRREAVPGLAVRLFLHVGRREHDTRLDAAIIEEYASRLAAVWPEHLRPTAYYDPRGLSLDVHTQASWHAKCVVVDDEVALVTSANFTEWAHHRNVEAGVLVRNRHFARQLVGQFDNLVHARMIQRLPRF